VSLPVRVRITAWYVVLLAVIVAAVGAFLVVRLRADLTRSIDGTLRPAAGQIAGDYHAEGTPDFQDSANTVLAGERATAQVLNPDGRVVTAFGDPVARRPMATRDEIAEAMAGRSLLVTHRLAGQAFRLTVRQVAHAGRRQVLVAGQSLAPVERSVRRVVVLLLLAGPAALLATAVGGWWLARRSLRPVEHMTSTAAAIEVGRLAERVPEPRARDELAHLARTLNTMLDRIERGVAEQRRLVADASHELRSPLAAMRAELDVSLRTDELSPDARAVLESTREEVDALSRTVDDLLTLAAVDDALELRRERSDLASLAARVGGALQPLALARGVTIEQAGPAAPVHADHARLAHAIRNVVENAIKFSPAGGTVRLTTGVDGATARLVIEDEGPGIPPELRERVFDRFYRVDASRTRATGGSGLGLAITREIVEAHGGRVRAEGRMPGSAFVLELPAASADGAPPVRDQQPGHDEHRPGHQRDHDLVERLVEVLPVAAQGPAGGGEGEAPDR
jgi:heavy metal sensor kinase